MKKILILGSSGLLGSKLLTPKYFSNEYEIYPHGFTQSLSLDLKFDILNRDDFFHKARKIDPDVIINLIGLTDVDYCESHPNQAYLKNVKSAENIVNFIKKNKKHTRLVHISTDQVYDGFGPHPESLVTLRNYYAFSKYTAELFIRNVENHIVLRTSFFGKSNHKTRISFSDWLFNSILEKKEIKVFRDILFTPLSMDFLCSMITHVVQKDLVGVYNLGSQSGLSKADFAYAFAQKLGLSSDLMTPISMNDVTFLKAHRPRDMRMDSTCFEKDFKITLPSLQDEIENVSKEYTK